MKACAEPPGADVTAPQLMWPRVSATYPTVRTASAIVRISCTRMITLKPKTPENTTTAAMTMNATIFVPSPPPQPRRSNTVAVASVASDTSTVSQPTRRMYESAAGILPPCTPYAARLSTIVGADPRLPARDTNPTSTNERIVPARPATVACQNDTPKPRKNDP